MTLENANAQQVDVNDDMFVGATAMGNSYADGSLFGYTDWVEIQSNGDFNGGPSGSFDIIANAYTEVVVLLKSANSFGAYLYSDGLSGMFGFTTAATGSQGQSQGLSNYVVVGRVSEVPLPASALLLIGGLGGLMVLRRRK
jgi:hypothetical protein